MNTNNLKCHRCGHDLVVLDTYNFDGERGDYTSLHCPYCGADYEVDEPSDEEKKEYDFYKDGEPVDERHEGLDVMNEYCINCGHRIYVGSNFMLSDMDDTITDIDDDKMNFSMNQCPHCGCIETRWDNSENEKKDYPYWKEDNVLYENLEGRPLSYVVHVWSKVNKVPFEKMKDELESAKSYIDTLIQMQECHRH